MSVRCCTWRLWILLTISAYNCLGTLAKYEPPQIELAPEYILHANENFNITCTSSAKPRWEYPSRSNKSSSEITWTIEKVNLAHHSYRTTLYIKNASYLDTGYFYCLETGADYHDETRSAKTYLFIEDEEHLIAGDEYVTTVMASASQPEVVLPCRPTSPNVHVELQKPGSDVQGFDWHMKKVTLGVPENDTQLIYDYEPDIGFTISRTADDTLLTDFIDTLYICSFSRDGHHVDIDVVITVMPNTTSIKKPLIEDLSMGHTVVGQTLTLNCSIYETLIPTAFKWRLPPRNGIRRNDVTTPSNYTDKCQYALLKIENVTMEDKGDYMCIVEDYNRNRNQASLDVEIFDVNETHIWLEEENDLEEIEENAGKSVFINVEINAHPIDDLQLQWLDKSKQPIADWEYNNNNPQMHMNNVIVAKYKAEFKPTETTLEIFNIDIKDYGEYTIVASNNFTKASKTFHLIVNDKPTVQMRMADFHLYESRTSVICTVAASPPAKVQWRFKCLDANEDCGLNDSDKAETNKALTHISKINVTARGSGEISCYAENDFGSDNITKIFHVSDVPNGFALYPSENAIDTKNASQKLIPVGDIVQLNCQASIYTYRKDFRWYFNDKPIKDDENYVIESGSTRFSYKSTLRIKTPETGDYKCSVSMTPTPPLEEMSIKSATLSLKVSDLQPPSIVRTNMGNTTLYMDLPEQLALTCYVGGIPRPSIVWMRNDLVIPLDNRTELLDGGQRLVFKKTIAGDDGRYTCYVRNKVGELRKEIQVTFNNKPIPDAFFASAMGVLVIILMIIMGWSIHQCIKEKKYKKQLEELGLKGFKEGDIKKINPDQGLSEQAFWLPYEEDRWEFPFEKLELGKQLGSGAFGVVMKGQARGILDDEDTTTVAVKTVRPDADTVHLRALMSELKIMGQIGKNLNVVNLLGACTTNLTKKQLYVIVEFCRYGNLQSYLLKHRKYFVNQIDEFGKFDFNIIPLDFDRSFSISSYRSNSQSSQKSRPRRYPLLRPNSHSQAESDYTGKTTRTDTSLLCSSPSPEDTVTSNNSTEGPEWRLNYRGDYEDHQLLYSKDLLAWAFQVARGMDYLVSKKVLHRDLAARNILLADDNVVKICDFGLAKETLDYVKQSGDAPLPVKWMAVESIHDKVFSTQSDVWAYGIVLWEFFSLAKSPYPGMTVNDEFMMKILSGYRMEAPQYSTKEVYKIMLDCWEKDPRLRPTFKQLEERIGAILGAADRQYYIDLNDPYLTPNNMPRDTDYLSMFAPPDFEHLSSVPQPQYVNEWQGPDLSGYVCMKQQQGIFSPRPPDYAENVFKYDSLSNDSGVELQPMLFIKSNSNDLESPQSPPSDLTMSVGNPCYLDFDDPQKNANGIVKPTPMSHTYQNMNAFNPHQHPKHLSLEKLDPNGVKVPCNSEVENIDPNDVPYMNASTRDWDRIAEPRINR